VNPMTSSEQDYVKAIYELGGHEKLVSNKSLSEELSVSPASVSEMVKRLLAGNYIIYEPYKGISLTDSGRNKAIQVIRRHRLWEVFLVEHLGYNWDEVHEEAEMLEHTMSQTFEERLYTYLQAPKVCPHGSPIPNLDGVIEKRNSFSLQDVDVGEKIKVVRVKDDHELLNYLKKLNFKLNAEYTVEDIAPYNGPITLVSSNQSMIIGREASKHIFVIRQGEE